MEIPVDQHCAGGAEPARKRCCFVIGAIEVFNAFLVIMRLPFSTKSVAAKTIAQMVGRVDYFVIGIAQLIFGYGIYELVISDLDLCLEGSAEQHIFSR